MRALLGAVVVVAFAGFAGAEDKKIDAKKLIGKWEPAGETKKDAPKTVIEFAEGGKLVMHVTVGDKTEKVEGTYKLDGNKLDVSVAVGGKDMKETFTISKLTDTEITAKDSKGKEDSLKRVKAK